MIPKDAKERPWADRVVHTLPYLRGHIFYLLGRCPALEFEDAQQEVALRLLGAEPPFDYGPAADTNYGKMIAGRAITDLARRTYGRRFQRLRHEGDPALVLEAIPDPAGVDDALIQHETYLEVVAALRLRSPFQRTVMFLSAMGCSGEQVALAMGRTANAVTSSASRCRTRVRRDLTERTAA